MNWTLGLRFEGNTLSPQHLVHNADGTIGLASYQEANDELLSNVGLRRHLIKGNFVWDLPDIESAQRRHEGRPRHCQRLAAVRHLYRGLGAPYDATSPIRPRVRT